MGGSHLKCTAGHWASLAFVAFGSENPTWQLHMHPWTADLSRVEKREASELGMCLIPGPYYIYTLK